MINVLWLIISSLLLGTLYPPMVFTDHKTLGEGYHEANHVHRQIKCRRGRFFKHAHYVAINTSNVKLVVIQCYILQSYCGIHACNVCYHYIQCRILHGKQCQSSVEWMFKKLQVPTKSMKNENFHLQVQCYLTSPKRGFQDNVT